VVGDANQELPEQFDGLTTDTVIVTGSQKYGRNLFHDPLIRLTVDAREPDRAYEFLRAYKEILKSRFQQIDIWITAHDVYVL
jgi:hypothetical protein